MSLRKKTEKGIFWSIADQIFRVILTLSVSIFLARLIAPAEFGLLAMVTVFIGFLEIFKNFGLGSALIQKTQIQKIEIDSIFWLNAIIGLLLGILIFFSAPIIAHFYHEEKLIPLTRVMAIIFFIGSFGIVPDALIRKQIEFKKLFYRNIFNILIAGGIAIFLAYIGWGVWALVVQRMITTISSVIINFRMITWFPNFSFDLKKIRPFVKFSIPLLGENSMNYWVRNIDNLSIGKVLGETTLGYYSRAYTLMLLPVRQISGSISRVMFPSFSIIKNDRMKVWNNYIRIVNFTVFITFPLMGFLFLFSKEFILLLYGEKWLPMVSIFKGLSFLGAIQSIGTYSGSIFTSQGKTQLQFKIGIIVKLFMISGILLGLFFNGIIGLIIGYTITSSIAFFIETYYVTKILNVSLKEFLKYIYKEIFLSIGLTALFFILFKIYDFSLVQRLFLVIILGGSVFIFISEKLHFLAWEFLKQRFHDR